MKPCKCGKPARLFKQGKNSYYIACTAVSEYCWIGPTTNTESEAEASWDQLMGEEEQVRTVVRKPILSHADSTGLIVICDDGSVFMKTTNALTTSWIHCDPIPGTAADKEAK